MAKTQRVLTLLEALQDHPFSTGPQLADRLGVDVRTLRRDVSSLRDLGIPVEAERGAGGGYRLRPGYRKTHEVEVLLHTPLAAAAQRFPATLAELQPAAEGTLLRMRADSLEWVAGLLAGAGCDFTIHRPAALRTSVRALADRLRVA